ncbi:MAG: hypothetical protein M3488_11600 [Actinomycetota bacterium]|nr:hypothetical protein [Actinomycetota bacterium]
MVCLGCGRWDKTDLCRACGTTLVEAPDRLLDSDLLVRSCYEHGGAARRQIHAFKYRGSDRAGWLLARALVCLLPPAGVLVPLPRASWRTISYGIDPAFELARRVGSLSGLQVWKGLSPPLYKSGQAGRSRSQRDPPIFWLKSEPPATELILIDDVITTGRTLLRAQQTLAHPTRAARVVMAVTATATRD